MTKRLNLAAALRDSGAQSVAQTQQKPAALEGRDVASSPRLVEKPAAEARPSGNAGRPPSREGQRAVTLYVSPETHKQLRLLGVEQGASVQDLMTEALNDLFKKNGRSLTT